MLFKNVVLGGGALVTIGMIYAVGRMPSPSSRAPKEEPTWNATKPAVKPIVAPAAQPDMAPSGGAWTEGSFVSVMDATATSMVSVLGMEELPTLSGPQKPDLTIRCKGKSLDVMFIAKVPFAITGEDPVIRYRTESTKPVSQRWTESEDREAAFSRKPRELYAQILKAQRLYVEFSPIAGPNRIAIFEVAGLAQHAAALKPCVKQ